MRIRTLRAKLTLAYAALLFVGLVLFAAVTFATTHELRRTTLDDRIDSATRALIALTFARNGTLRVVTIDRIRFGRIVGALESGAIVSRDGQVLMTSVTALPPELVALAKAPPKATTVRTVAVGSNLYRVGITPVPRIAQPLGVAIVWRTLEGISSADRRLILSFALTIPAIVAFALIAGNLVAARGLRPLQNLADLASDIEAESLASGVEIVPPKELELNALCVTFNRMLARLKAAFERERRFAGDASHELRAPLAVIRAEADLTLRRPREREEYERALHAISTQVDRLDALARDLLAEARAESGARMGHLAEVDLTQIAREVADQLAPLALERGIAIEIADRPEAYVWATPDGLRRAVLCVIHNAVKFARARVSIDVRAFGEPRTAQLSVADDGPGFSPHALAHATERFWRDPQVRSGPVAPDFAGSGSGLGLAIAATLVAGANGRLSLANRRPAGAEVTIRLSCIEGAAHV